MDICDIWCYILKIYFFVHLRLPLKEPLYIEVLFYKLNTFSYHFLSRPNMDSNNGQLLVKVVFADWTIFQAPHNT